MNVNWTGRNTCRWAAKGSRDIDGRWCGRFGWASLDPRARFIRWGWHIHKRGPYIVGQDSAFVRQRDESQINQWKRYCESGRSNGIQGK